MNSILQPKTDEIEISDVVRGLLERRVRYFAKLGVNAHFTNRDRAMIERTMMDHRDASAEAMLNAAAFVMTQIERPFTEKAKQYAAHRVAQVGRA